ncbi:T9SS type A sorting domain-containing protein [Hymenobacter aquaticus]|uniref:T9SS type A sorting domain-containing protein n=1 Tax=Hymenobacter aquaticus TaxID=1867101 RepID=A0A4Z0Q9W3_9BACT|nr:T9SS type A sorting domain-containing protein [Hymenobacter aquaticus]TGE25522.1 T9SS type A sorting domain-containing protein [Hymenobacter aquaticus]
MALFTPSIARLRSLPVAALLLGFSFAAQAQTPVGIAGGNAIYRQNFDGMTATGTAYPDGWNGVRFSGTGTAPVALLVSDGSGTGLSGAPYNVGTTGAADRALGSVASGGTVPAIGAAFINATGATVTRVNMAFYGEQWRSGSALDQNEVLAFEYSFDATSLTTGTWTAVPALNVTEVANANVTNGALNGNDTANRVAVSGSINSLNWPFGATMWIRWKDNNDTGNDAMLAVDDFALSTGTTTLATQNKALQGSLSVFPNPATNRLTLRTGKEGVGAAVAIYNALGQRVQQTVASQEEVTLDVSALRAGVYTVRFTTAEGIATRSFVKQ